jgi:hypothetical protein
MRFFPDKQEYQRELDLSDEIPGEHADLKVRTEITGYWSHLGNAVLYVGGAREHASQMHVDVDGLVELLRDEGVTEESMSSLAVIVHSRQDLSQNKRFRAKVAGWHSHTEGISLESAADRESVQFARALHVVGGASEEKLNHNLLHEAGHLKSHATGTNGEYTYGEQSVRRLRRKGYAGLAASALAEAGTIYGLTEGLPGPVGGVWIGIGAVGLLASGVVARFPAELLWLTSAEERNAERFAHRRKQNHQFVHASDGPLPDNHFLVREEDCVSTMELKFNFKQPPRLPGPPEVVAELTYPIVH